MYMHPDIKSMAEILKSGGEGERAEACFTLGSMGDRAVPALIDVLKTSSGGRPYAASALIKIGEPAAPPLTELLQSNDEGVWSNAAWMLGQIGESAVEPLIGLMSRVRDEDILCRVVPAFARIGAPAVQHLEAALQGNRLEGDGRLYAAISLKNIGEAAIPALKKLVNDANPAVCYIAEKALSVPVGQPKEAVAVPEKQPKEAKAAAEKKREKKLKAKKEKTRKRPDSPFIKSTREVPEIYDPRRHYNCLVETIPTGDRQAVYQEFRKRGLVIFSHVLADGRLQLAVIKLSEAIKAINAVAREKVMGVGLTKARLIQLMATHPEMEMTFIEKTKNPNVLHAEKAHMSQLVVDSEEKFRSGTAHHEKKEYRKAIACYDKAIKLEPEDVRAWHNKIIALGQDCKLSAAIRTADEALGKYPNVAFLWEAKGHIFAWMGKVIEAGECYSKATQMAKDISAKHEKRIAPEDKRLQTLLAECKKSGRDPDTDVNFWINKFAEYTNEGDAQGAVLSLQMAATIAPSYFIMNSDSQMILLPPGHMLLSKELLPVDAKIENLRDFFNRVAAASKSKHIE